MKNSLRFLFAILLVAGAVCLHTAGVARGESRGVGFDTGSRGAGRFKDRAARQEAVDKLKERYDREKRQAWAIAESQGWSPKGVAGGRHFELVAIRDGKVYMHTTCNEDAAESVGANLIAEVSPFFLDGAGFKIGIWDEAPVYTSHGEFGGRVTKREGSGTSDHATHVAGTIGAAGNSSSAKGMAPAVSMDSWDFDDDAAEMAGQGASAAGDTGKIYVSNHSYGFIAGWYDPGDGDPMRWYGEWGDDESEDFGIYDSYAVDWDQICYDSPYYLPFKAAGNDRNDSPPAEGESFEYWSGWWRTRNYNSSLHPGKDGGTDGFDTIKPVGNAKNIMTVGSVRDATRDAAGNFVSGGAMENYSGWGPADDGRIKPDVVANGYSLRSTSSNGSYMNMSGTSMATPNASGSSVLLLDHYQSLFGADKYMRASTLKALMIHTADDMGRTGPDYEFGWGLINVKAAADALTRHYHSWPCSRIVEGQLTNGDSDSWDIAIDDTSADVKFTVCWTDPAGTAKSGLDNPAKALVNDLDLRVTGPDATVHEPFVLNLSNPSAVATTGDNAVDNVEQVVIPASMPAGAYTVEITHKGSLSGGSQWYSLVSDEGLLSGALDGDCVVSFSDFAILSNYWQDTCDSGNDWCEGADTDTSGGVGLVDLGVIADHWLAQ